MLEAIVDSMLEMFRIAVGVYLGMALHQFKVELAVNLIKPTQDEDEDE